MLSECNLRLVANLLPSSLKPLTVIGRYILCRKARTKKTDSIKETPRIRNQILFLLSDNYLWQRQPVGSI